MTTEPTQLTDSDLNQMMLNNGLEIVWSEAKEKWVLNRKYGKRAIFMKSSKFKSLLYAAVKMIDRRRVKRLAQ